MLDHRTQPFLESIPNYKSGAVYTDAMHML